MNRLRLSTTIGHLAWQNNVVSSSTGTDTIQSSGCSNNLARPIPTVTLMLLTLKLNGAPGNGNFANQRELFSIGARTSHRSTGVTAGTFASSVIRRGCSVAPWNSDAGPLVLLKCS